MNDLFDVDLSREQKEPEDEFLTKVIDGIEVPTQRRHFYSANILSCEVGTTGYCGGDSGNGGRTYIKISDGCSTDLRCKIIKDDKFRPEYHVDGVEIVLGGDCELDTIIDAFEYAAKVLKEKRDNKNKS